MDNFGWGIDSRKYSGIYYDKRRIGIPHVSNDEIKKVFEKNTPSTKKKIKSQPTKLTPLPPPPGKKGISPGPNSITESVQKTVIDASPKINIIIPTKIEDQSNPLPNSSVKDEISVEEVFENDSRPTNAERY